MHARDMVDESVSPGKCRGASLTLKYRTYSLCQLLPPSRVLVTPTFVREAQVALAQEESGPRCGPTFKSAALSLVLRGACYCVYASTSHRRSCSADQRRQHSPSGDCAKGPGQQRKFSSLLFVETVPLTYATNWYFNSRVFHRVREGSRQGDKTKPLGGKQCPVKGEVAC